MADNTVLVAAITAVSSGGLVGAIATFIKVRPEAGQILIKSATDVVVIQRDAMTDLRTRLASVEQERDTLRDRLATVEREKTALEERVTELAQSLSRLREQVTGSPDEKL